jgi:hypothetical protein
MSTRADPTERTRSIPATHPLANSIAPGGSAVSTPPRPRRSGRWQVALGVAALIAIGFGSRYLQTRGEHHAASGLPAERGEEDPLAQREEASARLTEQDLIARQVAEAEAAREAEAVQQAEAVEQAEALRQAEAAQRAEAGRQSEAARRAESRGHEAEARHERVASRKANAREAAEGESPMKGRSMRIALGDARMVEREQAEGEGDPDRAQVIAAMNALTHELKECVGSEHGVADVTLTVRAPGVVSHALVEGAFADSPQGTCIARRLRSAKLPPFTDPITRIEYPFQL